MNYNIYYISNSEEYHLSKFGKLHLKPDCAGLDFLIAHNIDSFRDGTTIQYLLFYTLSVTSHNVWSWLYNINELHFPLAVPL
jgi:hypothetical protein